MTEKGAEEQVLAMERLRSKNLFTIIIMDCKTVDEKL